MIIREKRKMWPTLCLPVGSNSNWGAAQTDVHEEARDVEPEQGGDETCALVASGHNARAALVGGRRGHWGRGVRDGGSKGLSQHISMCLNPRGMFAYDKGAGDSDGELVEHL